MANKTKIEWTDATWNPVTGCSIVSPGCTNCYAMNLAGMRLKNHPSRAGLTKKVNGNHVWTGEVRFNEQWLTQPLHWRKPRMIFVCAHSDLFHEDVPDEWIDRIFAVMALCPQHTFQVLTKRAERMRKYLMPSSNHRASINIEDVLDLIAPNRHKKPVECRCAIKAVRACLNWPLPNVWLGVSVEDQRHADERIPHLLDTPAAVRFISAEPLLGPIDLTLDGLIFEDCPDDCEYAYIEPDTNAFVCRRCEDSQKTDNVGIDWAIVGGESGPNARPIHPDWTRSLRDQCADAEISFFFKQWGEWIDADEWLQIIQAGPGNILRSGEPWKPSTPLNFEDAQTLSGIGGFQFEAQSCGRTMLCVGKNRAGRLLDGVEHNGMPEAW